MGGGAGLPGNAGPHHAAGRLAVHAAALDAHHPAHAQQMAQQRAHQMPSPAPAMDNWAADFARFSGGHPQPQQAAPPPPVQQHLPMQQPRGMAEAFGFQPAMGLGMQPNGGFAPLYGPTNGGFMDANVASAQRPAAEADFDEEMSRWMSANGAAGPSKGMEDVDAVMDQMARELEISDAREATAQPDTTQSTQAATTQDTQAQADDVDRDPPILFSDMSFSDLNRTELNNMSKTDDERPHTPPQEQAQPQPQARSEVSEAAERLLESVQHESGDKWVNSTFLSLMRDFRDGKKDIVDNEIRTAETHASVQEGRTCSP